MRESFYQQLCMEENLAQIVFNAKLLFSFPNLAGFACGETKRSGLKVCVMLFSVSLQGCKASRETWSL